jgi:hypothetical protein
MRAYSIYTRDAGPLSRLICSPTGGIASHVATGYELTHSERDFILARMVQSDTSDRLRTVPAEVGGLYRFYIESHANRDDETGCNGVRGPYPVEKLRRWQRKRDGRKVIVQPLPRRWFTDDAVAHMLLAQLADVGVIGYDCRQIWFNWKFYRLGLGIRRGGRDRQRRTCIEEHMIHMPPEFLVRGLDALYRPIEEWAPSARPSRGWGFYEAIDAMLLHDSPAPVGSTATSGPLPTLPGDASPPAGAGELSWGPSQ